MRKEVIRQEAAQPTTVTRRVLIARIFVASRPMSWASYSAKASVLGVAGGLGLMSGGARAQYVEVAMAGGSAVVSLISSRRKSDGGMGAMMKASLAYQRILSEQMVSLQNGMVQLLRDVEQLPEKFQKLLYKNDLQRMQNDVGAYLMRYDEEAKQRASQFASYQAWKNNPLTIENSQSILFGLNQSIALLHKSGQCDVMTALYIPS